VKKSDFTENSFKKCGIIKIMPLFFTLNQKKNMVLLDKTNSIIKKIFSKYVWDFLNNENKVYLTFDDGPHPKLQNGF
jgi:peptidoglycan/xylan/chitin deacetylase (PgdA/CDA1 family)